MTQSATTSSARPSLLDRLALAESEGIAANLGRFLRFRGTRADEPVELQALAIPTGGRWFENRFGHGIGAEELVRLASEMEKHKPTGIYLINNEVDPAVATRAERGRWHLLPKGESTTDAEILTRRVIFVDVDSRRPRGTSATDRQVAETLEVAFRIHARFAALLGGPDALGLGHSGNGTAVMVALDSLPNTEEVLGVIKGILAALAETFSEDMVEIDVSVCDAKRLGPAWGTTKRKGAPGIAERPHRRTAFVCEEHVLRIGLDGLATLLASLYGYLNDEQRVEVDRAMGKRTTPPNAPSFSSESPFARANAVPVADVLGRLGLLVRGELTCVGCGTSGHSSVAIVGNGVKCLHARCADKGPPGRAGFRSVVDLTCESQRLTPVEAVKLLAGWFGFEGMPERRQQAQHQNGNGRAHHVPDDTQHGDAWEPEETPPPYDEVTGEVPVAAAPPPPPELIRVLTLDELLAPLEAPNYLVEAFDMCPGRPAQITGTGFAGKTIAVQSMAISTIVGSRVWGEFHCRQGFVGHLDYEMGRRASLRRYRRLCAGMGVSWERQVAPFLRLAPLPALYLNSPKMAEGLKRFADGLSFVILDSLRRSLPGEDENDSSITEYIDVLTRVSEDTGVVFAFLHHSTTKSKTLEGQDTRGAGRGSSAIYDASGAVITLTGKKGEPVKVEQTKAPERGTAFDDFFLVIEDVEIEGDPRGGVRVRHEADEPPAAGGNAFEESCERVLSYIRDQNAEGRGVAGKAAVAGGAAMKDRAAAAAVDTLLARGLIEDRPEAKRPRYWAVRR